MELQRCKYSSCKFKPKEMIGGYCGKHQRNRIYDEGLTVGKLFCRYFFRGCNNEVREGVKTCSPCMVKNRVGQILCKHSGCRFKVSDGMSYCGKHERYKYYDEEKEKGIRYCDITRGCFTICEKDKAKCDICLEVDRIKEKERYDERLKIANGIRSVADSTKRLCVMCGKEYEKFYTIRGAESTRCEGCQNTMRTTDAKREDRVRSYKVENMKNTERYYKQYYMSAHKRSYAFELTLDEFSSLVVQPCYHCNYFKEGEANGIDRVDNSKGYSMSNCLPCCEMCNRMKHVYHLDFFLAKMKQISSNTPPSSEFTLTWKDYYPLKTSRYKHYKSVSAARGVPLNLTEDQYNEITHKPCYLCGYSNPDGIGIDRLDNSVHEYTYENCRPCCKPCNMMKASFSHTEFLDKCKAIAKHYFSLDKTNILSSNEPCGNTFVA